MKMEITNNNNCNNRMIFLQQRQKEIEKLLLEKNELLRKLCLQEAELTGVVPSEIPVDDNSTTEFNSNFTNCSTGNLTLRRKVETGFKLPENLLSNNCNNEDDEITQLLLDKQVQTSISEAALNMANDQSNNKVVRRKQRHVYKQSQQKINEINDRIDRRVQNQQRSQLKLYNTEPNNVSSVLKQMPTTDANNSIIDQNYPQSPISIKHFDHSTGDHSNTINRVSDYVHNQMTGDTTDYVIKRQLSINSKQMLKDQTNTIMYYNHHVIPSDHHYNTQPHIYRNSPMQLPSPTLNISPIKSPSYSPNHSINMKQQSYHMTPQSTQQALHHSQQKSRKKPRPLDEYRVSKVSINSSVPDQFNQRSDHDHQSKLNDSNTLYLQKTISDHRFTSIDQQRGDLDLHGIDLHSNSVEYRQAMGPVDQRGVDFYYEYVDRSAHYFPQNHAVNINESAESVNFGSLDRRKGVNGSPLQALSKDHFKTKLQIRSHSIGELAMTEDIYDTISIGSNSSNKNKEKQWYETSLDDPTASVKSLPKSNSHYDTKLIDRHPHITHHHQKPLHNKPPLISAEYPIYNTSPPAYNNDRHLNTPIKQFNKDQRTANNVYNWQKYNDQHEYLCSPYNYDSIQHYPPPPPASASISDKPAQYPAVIISPGEEQSLDDFRQLHLAGDSHKTVVLPTSSHSQSPHGYYSPGNKDVSHPHAVQNYLSPHVENNSEKQAFLINAQQNVPLESPKNVEVVSPGKWLPYKEVSKPFEMADFYKYSTKFRNKNQSSQDQENRLLEQNQPAESTRSYDESTETTDVDSQQTMECIQKGIYQPLKPMKCQPLINKSENPRKVKSNTATLV